MRGGYDRSRHRDGDFLYGIGQKGKIGRFRAVLFGKLRKKEGKIHFDLRARFESFELVILLFAESGVSGRSGKFVPLRFLPHVHRFRVVEETEPYELFFPVHGQIRVEGIARIHVVRSVKPAHGGDLLIGKSACRFALYDKIAHVLRFVVIVEGAVDLVRRTAYTGEKSDGYEYDEDDG